MSTDQRDPADPSTSNQEFGRWLRDRPLEEQKQWTIEQFGKNPIAAYDVARRLPLKWHDARDIVEASVGQADASSIRWWLELYASLAGLRRTLTLLDEWDERGDKDRGSKGRYWVRFLDAAKSEQGQRILEEAVAEGEGRGG